MDNIFFRLAVVCLLGGLGLVASNELRKPDKLKYQEEHERALRASGDLEDGQEMNVPADAVANPVKLLTYFVILAAGIGFVAVQWVIPMLGDAVSTATFSSGEKLGPSVHAKALSFVTQGRYPEALEEFQRVAAEDPTDRFPVMEIVKLQLGKLDDVDGAIETLRGALELKWPEEDGTFFAQKLSDLYRNEKDDLTSAKEILQQLIEQFPGSPAAGNATHKLRELEEAEFLASRAGH
jgi:tetratricopeptide (TPR) repeat protein